MANNTPSSLICFKNGYSYVNIPVSLSPDPESTTDADIKECQVGPLPNFAVHGTVSLAAYNPETVKIFSLSQAAKKVIKPTPLKFDGLGESYSYEAILAANIGTAVSLTCLLETGNAKSHPNTFAGVVKAVHKEQSNNSFVVLKSLATNGGECLIRCSTIAHLETIQRKSDLNDDANEDEEDGMESVKCLSVRYATSLGSTETVEANLSYLTRGLMWAPSYMLRQYKSNKTLTLQGNACLLCDLPFFKGKSIESVSLVAGQPKMECQNISDPLASGVTAADFIHELEGDSYGGSHMKRAQPRMMAQSRMAAAPVFGGAFQANSMPECASAEGISAGESMDDLYFYRLKNVPLHYNRPMSLPFIEECASEPYQDVYFFDLNNKGSGNDDTMVEATHAITFKNTSGQPFTTGPVSVIMAEECKNMDEDDKTTNSNENNFLVQGLMKFTGPNKIATVEITKALDVEGKFVLETSKERKVEAKKQVKDDVHELVCIQKTGTVTITNLKDEEVKCKIDHLLYGQLEKSEPSHMEVTERNVGHHDLNPTAKYVWQVKVPPKGKAELVFTFVIKQWDRNSRM